MKLLNYLVNLKLFDGADDEQAGSEPGQAANASQSTGSEKIEYGIADEPVSSNTDSQVPPTSGTQQTPEQRAEAYKQFKETFKDEYTNDFNNHFNNRFKDYKAIESKASQVDTLNPIVQSYMKYHGVETVEELKAILQEDEALDAGFPDVEKYNFYKKGKEAEELTKKAQTEDETRKQTEAKVDDWLKQGEKLTIELAKSGITIDFNKEVSDPKFIEKLQLGNSVEETYFLLHRQEMLANTAKNVEENLVQSIQSGSKKVNEGGTKPGNGVVRKSDPSKLTDADLVDIQQRVARGEKIKF